MTEYDITEAFRVIENELIASMIRNMKRHRAEETEEGIQWTMWQSEQLKALEKYKKENQEKYGKEFKNINKQIAVLISEAREAGNMRQEVSILNAIKNGFKYQQKPDPGITGEFFRLNDRKLEALISATTHDMEKAETAVLRMANDQYRKVIFNAQVYANAGAGTYKKAVDMATKDMLSAGLNCVEYKNGARHTLSDYADMAIRTASKRAYLQGEGEKRKEWGISTVIMNKRGNPCPKCLPFCGKVLIDDVWSGGTSKDGPYPLMSHAVSHGLYHPRCKDSHTTYFPGISTADDTWTKKELESVGLASKLEVKKQYAQRQVEKFDRLARFSLDEDNQEMYADKRKTWKGIAKKIDSMMEHEPLRINELPGKYQSDIYAMISKADPLVQSMFLRYVDDIGFTNIRAIGGGVSGRDGIRVNLKTEDQNIRGQYTTTFHEMGHAIDRAAGGISYKTTTFREALQSDFDNLVKAYTRVYNVEKDEAYLMIGDSLKEDRYHSVSDIIDGITRGRCKGKYGHEPKYWTKRNALEKESFAHFFEAYARNDKEKIQALSETFPKATEEFFKLLGEK